VRPWTPPGADTIQVWAAEVRAVLRAQPTDSIDAATKTAYDKLGGVAWRFLRSLGRARVGEIAAVESALDSLGFDTDLVADPVIPSFVSWWRAIRIGWTHTRWATSSVSGRPPDDAGDGAAGRTQALIRVWWNNEAEALYVWGLVIAARRSHGVSHVPNDLRRWILAAVPMAGHGPTSAGRTRRSGWTSIATCAPNSRPGSARSRIRCSPNARVPPRLIERTYADRRRAGFELIENRVMATPYATFHRLRPCTREPGSAGGSALCGEAPTGRRGTQAGLGVATRR
jgi:hypothetical protein